MDGAEKGIAREETSWTYSRASRRVIPVGIAERKDLHPRWESDRHIQNMDESANNFTAVRMNGRLLYIYQVHNQHTTYLPMH